MDKIIEYWDFELASTASGSITPGNLTLSITLLLIAYFVSRMIGWLCSTRLSKTDITPDAINAIKRVVFYAIFAGVGMSVLSLLGIPLTAFAFATGAVAIGIGFGAQNIINNFFSGWIIMAERPVRVGDVIEVGDIVGKVEYIGTRSTRVHRSDGAHMLIPNSTLLQTTVVNWNIVDNKMRATIPVDVACDADPEEVVKVIKKVLDSQEGVLDHPAPSISFDDFGDNRLAFKVYVWGQVSGAKSLGSIKSEIRFKLSSEFKTSGIELAHAQRVVHVKGVGGNAVLDDIKG